MTGVGQPERVTQNRVIGEKVGEKLGETRAAMVKYMLKRIGPAKGGHWEVLK
mgnify:CR=1 FL=1